MTLPYSNPTTSYQAARSVSPTKVQQDRKAITELLARLGPDGACDDEIGRAIPSINTNSVRIRRQECMDYGLISNMCGQLNKTASNKNATAYHITAHGLELLGPEFFGMWCCDEART